MEKPLFKVLVMESAKDFIDSLPTSASDKIYYNIRKVRFGVRDQELFKKLGDTDIWEFRTRWQGMAYRLLAFWDKDENTLVVITHGFAKKSQKTPKSEIAKAERLRVEYFNNKNSTLWQK